MDDASKARRASLRPDDRAERNALGLASASLTMRARGDGDAADALERLHDALVAAPRRERLPAAPPRDDEAPGSLGDPGERAPPSLASDRPTRRIEARLERDAAVAVETAEPDAVVALLLALAGSGDRARTPPAASESNGDATAARRRAERATAALRLAPIATLPAFGSGRPARAPRANAKETDPSASAIPFATGARLDASPGSASFAAFGRGGAAGTPGTEPEPDGSLFGALARARLPPPGGMDDALGAALVVPPSEDAFDAFDAFAFAERGEDEAVDEVFVPDLAALEIDSAMETSSSGEEEEEEGEGTARFSSAARRVFFGRRRKTPTPRRRRRRRRFGVARGGARRRVSRASRATLGWDAAPARAPPCGAFTSRGAAAFGRAYEGGAWHSKAAESALFGEPAPAEATVDEVVHAARRALVVAGGEDAERLERELFAGVSGRVMNDRSAPPLRLPAASAEATAGALAPLAEATKRRAALEAALERGAASQGPQFLLPKRNEATAVNTSSSRTTAEKAEKVPPDLATQSARREARDMLRALDAATLALPAAAAARRDAERLCAARMTEAYHARGGFDGKDAAAGPDSGGVTLLEALAHTRSIRARVAALADLFGGDPLDARSSYSSSSSSSGAALLRRTARRLAFAGAGERDGSVDWTLRRVAAAAAAPMLAQMRAWTSAARVRDPRAEFPVATSPDWGSSAATLEWAPAERTLRSFRRRTERAKDEGVRSEGEDEGVSEDEDEDDGFERLRTASDSDASSARARLPPWEGGPPGSLRSAAARTNPSLASDERAWLRAEEDGEEEASRRRGARSSSSSSPRRRPPHPLFAGVELAALQTGAQLRILQRLPQTAAFAEAISKADEALGDDWTLAFDAASLRAANRRAKRARAAMERAADAAIRDMAASRVAWTRRADARARGARRSASRPRARARRRSRRRRRSCSRSPRRASRTSTRGARRCCC